MAVPKGRTSKSRRDKRRTHQKLKNPVNLISCSNCGEKILPHRACPACGHFKGRQYKVIVQS